MPQFTSKYDEKIIKITIITILSLRTLTRANGEYKKDYETGSFLVILNRRVQVASCFLILTNLCQTKLMYNKKNAL